MKDDTWFSTFSRVHACDVKNGKVYVKCQGGRNSIFCGDFTRTNLEATKSFNILWLELSFSAFRFLYFYIVCFNPLLPTHPTALIENSYRQMMYNYNGRLMRYSWMILSLRLTRRITLPSFGFETQTSYHAIFLRALNVRVSHQRIFHVEYRTKVETLETYETAIKTSPWYRKISPL